MAIDISGAVSSVEERERQRRNAERKRLFILASACIAVVGVRLLIKNPEPPKAADHSDKPFRALPGVLDNIPAAERSKIKPEILAQLREADLKATKKADPVEQFFERSRGHYQPADTPNENPKDKEMEKEFQYQYVHRQRIIEQKKEAVVIDPYKSTLVRFKNGRYVKARSTHSADPFLAIVLDKTMVASLNKKQIISVTNDAQTWQEPVPKGTVRLKPAKGITITVDKNTAERITITAPFRNES
jgi:hypothetical protein